MKDLLFTFEVEINSAIGDAGFAGNVRNFGVEVTVVGENANGGAQNCFAFVGNYGAV